MRGNLQFTHQREEFNFSKLTRLIWRMGMRSTNLRGHFLRLPLTVTLLQLSTHKTPVVALVALSTLHLLRAPLRGKISLLAVPEPHRRDQDFFLEAPLS